MSVVNQILKNNVR